MYNIKCQATKNITEFIPNELPIIMLTSKNQVSDLIAGLSSGANDYLTKPFNLVMKWRR